MKEEQKLFHIVDFMITHRQKKVIIFFLTCATVDYYFNILKSFEPIQQRFFPYKPQENLGQLQKKVSKGMAIMASRPSYEAQRSHQQPPGRAEPVTINGTRVLQPSSVFPIPGRKKPVPHSLLAPMHGQMTQNKRNRVLSAFRDCPAGVLLCTDVAARGVDVPNVDWILQVDAPQNPDVFVHRVGRTARAGHDGHALLFLSEKEDAYVDYLKMKEVYMSQVDIPPVDERLTQVLRQRVSEIERKNEVDAADGDGDGAMVDASVQDEEKTEGNVMETGEDEGVDPEDAIVCSEDIRAESTGKKRSRLEFDGEYDSDSDSVVEVNEGEGDASLERKNVVDTHKNKSLNSETEGRGEGGMGDTERMGEDEDKEESDDGEGENEDEDEDGTNQAANEQTEGTEEGAEHGISPRAPRTLKTLTDSSENIITHARHCIVSDRHIFNIAARAFVTHVRAYQVCLRVTLLFTCPVPFFPLSLSLVLTLSFSVLWSPRLHKLPIFTLFPVSRLHCVLLLCSIYSRNIFSSTSSSSPPCRLHLLAWGWGYFISRACLI